MIDTLLFLSVLPSP